MSFAALFIALLIERFFDCSHLRNWAWYAKYQRMVAQKLSGQSPYVVLAALAVPFLNAAADKYRQEYLIFSIFPFRAETYCLWRRRDPDVMK